MSDIIERFKQAASEEDESVKLIQEGTWEQDYKYQLRTDVFEFEGRYFEHTQSRSGSPFTDWDYGESWVLEVTPVTTFCRKTVYLAGNPKPGRVKLYAAGPMEGLSIQEMSGWRSALKLGVSTTVDILDPVRRVPFHATPSGEFCNDEYAKIVYDADMEDIDNSQICLFNLRRDAGRGVGTHMELMYAWMTGKRCIVWTDKEDFRHPFYICMHHVWVYSLEEAIEAINKEANALH
jgi:hypothetical protein